LGVRDLAALLARSTYTPIPFFLSMPIRELMEWISVVDRLLKGGKKHG
jgi:hypothetical protein